MSNLLTKTRLSAARLCQRFHDIEFIQGYRPLDEVAPLRFGTLCHNGLEAIWRKQPIVFPPDADPFDIAKLRPMLLGYQARWQDDFDRYEVLGVEEMFECELVNPKTRRASTNWRLAGVLDVLVRSFETGAVYVIEHKTSSQDISLGSSYWARLRMDTQISVYYAGADFLLRTKHLNFGGVQVSGVIYDVLKKPGLRPLEVNTRRSVAETADEYELRIANAIVEDPNAYYQRGEIVRLEDEMVDAMTDIWQQGQQMHEAERLGRSPRNPDACEKWGRLCDFFPVCSGETTLENERLYRLSSNVHPELSGPAKEEQPHGDTSSSKAATLPSTPANVAGVAREG